MSIELKPNKMVNETKLDRDEAVKFILFLEEEKLRHHVAINHCKWCKKIYIKCPVLYQAYQSSIDRHYEDIGLTQKTIDMLRAKYNIKIGEE